MHERRPIRNTTKKQQKNTKNQQKNRQKMGSKGHNSNTLKAAFDKKKKRKNTRKEMKNKCKQR